MSSTTVRGCDQADTRLTASPVTEPTGASMRVWISSDTPSMAVASAGLSITFSAIKARPEATCNGVTATRASSVPSVSAATSISPDVTPVGKLIESLKPLMRVTLSALLRPVSSAVNRSIWLGGAGGLRLTMRSELT